jgi:hypothetical protein
MFASAQMGQFSTGGVGQFYSGANTDRRYAIMWLKSPYKPFAGKKPADWLKDGDLDGVCGEIGRLVANQPDLR